MVRFADDPTTCLAATAADHFAIVANKWWDVAGGGVRLRGDFGSYTRGEVVV